MYVYNNRCSTKERHQERYGNLYTRDHTLAGCEFRELLLQGESGLWGGRPWSRGLRASLTLGMLLRLLHLRPRHLRLGLSLCYLCLRLCVLPPRRFTLFPRMTDRTGLLDELFVSQRRG